MLLLWATGSWACWDTLGDTDSWAWWWWGWGSEWSWWAVWSSWSWWSWWSSCSEWSCWSWWAWWWWWWCWSGWDTTDWSAGGGTEVRAWSSACSWRSLILFTWNSSHTYANNGQEYNKLGVHDYVCVG